MNIESLREYFKEIGIENDFHFPWCKNFYTVMKVTRNGNSYKGQQKEDKVIIKGPLGTGALPYRAVTWHKKIYGYISPRDLINKTELQYKVAILMSTILMYKLGCTITDRMVSNLEEYYKELQGKQKEIEFDVSVYEDVVKRIVEHKRRSPKAVEEYKAKLEKAVKLLSSKEQSKAAFQDIFTGKYEGDLEALDDISIMAISGKVSINPIANTNAGIVRTMRDLSEERIETHEAAKEYEREQEKLGNGPDPEQDAEYEKFIDRVYQEAVQEHVEKEKDLQLCLYEHLNREVDYNTIAFSWSQEHPKIKEIIKHDRSRDMNKYNKVVTCHTWSYAMRELLYKAGFDAYMVGGRAHRFVIFFDEEGNPWLADGTNAPRDDRPSWFRGSDITRTKMGMTPALLYRIKAVDEQLRDENEYYDKSIDGTDRLRSSGRIKKEQFEACPEHKFDIKKYMDKNGKIDFVAIFRELDQFPGLDDLFGKAINETVDEDSVAEYISEAVKFLTQGYENDDLLADTCISNLVFIIRNLMNNGRLSWDNPRPEYSVCFVDYLYVKDSENKKEIRTKVRPLVTISSFYGNEYYIWMGSEEGLVPISREEVRDKIRSGEIHSSTNNGKYDDWKLAPGLNAPNVSQKKEEIAIFGEDPEEPEDQGPEIE